MNKKICNVVAMLLICTSALLVIPKELNVGAISSEKKMFCFSSYDPNEAWEINPEGMLCNNTGCAATYIDGDVQLLDGNTCPASELSDISKVELKVYGFHYRHMDQCDIILRPVFPGGDGDDHRFQTKNYPSDSGWIDITTDTNAPQTWTWTHVVNLDCDVEADNDNHDNRFLLFCCKVEICVTST